MTISNTYRISLLLKVRLYLKTVLFNPGDAPAFTVSPRWLNEPRYDVLDDFPRLNRNFPMEEDMQRTLCKNLWAGGTRTWEIRSPAGLMPALDTSQYRSIFNKEGEYHHRRKQERTPRVPVIGTRRWEGGNSHSGTLTKKTKRKKMTRIPLGRKQRLNMKYGQRFAWINTLQLLLFMKAKNLINEASSQIPLIYMTPQTLRQNRYRNQTGHFLLDSKVLYNKHHIF